MILNGIDLDGLASQVSAIEVPEPVQGRVAHIDADFLAYQCSYEHADEIKDWEDMKHNAGEAVRTLMELCGATSVHLHLTPSTSDKGKRYELALLKEYQANRDGKDKPRFLNLMREHLVKAFNGTLHQNCEADDGMSSYQYAAIARGEEHLSIIASKDKDLRMVPGLHLDWDAGTIHDAGTTFGYIELDRSKSAPKVIGYGQKFFWAQMLMGDSADNISGLPRFPGQLLNKVRPTGPQVKLRESYKLATDEGKKASIVAKLKKALAERSSVTCGAVLAYDAINPLTSNKEAFEYVKEAYRLYGEEHGFTNYRTGEPVLWNKAFVSEAQLLWMRKNRADVMDVARWFAEIMQ